MNVGNKRKCASLNEFEALERQAPFTATAANTEFKQR